LAHPTSVSCLFIVSLEVPWFSYRRVINCINNY